MIKLNGKMYGTIQADINEAINALWCESQALKQKDQNNQEIQETAKLILDATEVIKEHYCEVYNSNEENYFPLEYIEVKGFFNGTSFLARGMDIITSLYENFCLDNQNLIIRKHNNSNGVFSYYDASYHGSPDYVYTLIYKGNIACSVYKAISYLYTNCREYNALIKEASKLDQQDKVRSLTPNNK